MFWIRFVRIKYIAEWIGLEVEFACCRNGIILMWYWCEMPYSENRIHITPVIWKIKTFIVWFLLCVHPNKSVIQWGLCCNFCFRIADRGSIFKVEVIASQCSLIQWGVHSIWKQSGSRVDISRLNKFVTGSRHFVDMRRSFDHNGVSSCPSGINNDFKNTNLIT